MKCDYCDEYVQEGDQKYAPDNLPDDIPWDGDEMLYHSWCFEEVIHEWRVESQP